MEFVAEADDQDEVGKAGEAGEAGDDTLSPLDDLLDATPILPSTVVDIDPGDIPLGRFTDDVAQKIWRYDQIARRYGMTDAQFMRFCAIPGIRMVIKAKRALWESDAGATARIKGFWGVGMEQAASTMISMMTDPTVNPSVRVEILKIGARLSGADAGPAKAADPNAQATTPFAITINLGGRTDTVSVDADGQQARIG